MCIYICIYIYMYVHTWNSWPERKMFGMSWVVEWFMAPHIWVRIQPCFWHQTSWHGYFSSPMVPWPIPYTISAPERVSYQCSASSEARCDSPAAGHGCALDGAVLHGPTSPRQQLCTAMEQLLGISWFSNEKNWVWWCMSPHSHG